MKIIIDAMGGDNAPAEILRGAADAVAELGVEILAVGDQKVILACAAEHNIPLQGIQILQASQAIEMCEEPAKAVRTKKDSSLVVGLKALAEGQGDAFVSAGSTGALLVGATFIVKRIKGVKRPALGAVMPSAEGPFILVDTGANVECTVPMLCQFARLGDIYMKKILGIQNPRVALANIGAEETKGTPLQVEAYQALEKLPDMQFTGNIEVRDIAFGKADVVVADGFTGNVIVKMYEGVAKMITNSLKAMFMKNLASKLSYLGVKGGMDEFKKKMDYKQYGGAPIIGVQKPVVKAHGSSDARAFCNAIKQAIDCTQNDVCGAIAEALKGGEAHGTASE